MNKVTTIIILKRLMSRGHYFSISRMKARIKRAEKRRSDKE
jgi:hypothetical protein